MDRGRLLIAPLLICLLAGVFGAGGAASGTRAAPTTISFGITDDAMKYAVDGGGFLFGDLNDLGMKDDRIDVFWDDNTPTKILEENFVDRMMPVAAAAGIRIVIAIQPIHALAFSTNTTAKVKAFAGFVKQVALRWPQVKEFVIGNEPNVKRFFQPQHNPDGSIASAVCTSRCWRRPTTRSRRSTRQSRSTGWRSRHAGTTCASARGPSPSRPCASSRGSAPRTARAEGRRRSPTSSTSTPTRTSTPSH